MNASISYLNDEFERAHSKGFSYLRDWWISESDNIQQACRDNFKVDISCLKSKVDMYLKRVDSYLLDQNINIETLSSKNELTSLKDQIS